MTAALKLPLEDVPNDLTRCQQKICEQHEKIIHLEAQIAWFRRQFFGKRSERIVSNLDEHQLQFEGFEALPQDAFQEENNTQTILAHKRRKQRRKGMDAIGLPPNLPVRTRVIDIPEKEKICPETGEPLVQIGQEVSRKLAQEPGQYYIKEIIRPKYAHPQRPENGIVVASLPDTILPRCRADDSLLAEIITKKFADHLPLYRIAEEMGRHDIRISHKLLSSWVVSCGLALQPLYRVMAEKILQSGNVYIDESPVKLQAKHRCDTAYLWAVVGGHDASPAYRIYDFRENRRHAHVPDILRGYRGVLHSDKYGAYQKLAEQKTITWAPCWAHLRRKFFEAEAGDTALRTWMLRKIRYLFMLERIAWARPPDERLRIRREKEVPIIDEIIAKVKERIVQGRLLPKSKLREALGYTYSLIPYLKNYTLNPYSRLDNNVAERAIRPLTIGRKNWLFFGSPDGGKAGAILLSFVQTCRGLGVNPREYLEDVFRRLLSHSARRLEELLPDQWLLARQTQTQHTSA